MIIGKRDRKRFDELEDMASRLHFANRWLAEFDDALLPLWDYLRGTRVEIAYGNAGETYSVMKESDIATVREKLRKRLGLEPSE